MLILFYLLHVFSVNRPSRNPLLEVTYNTWIASTTESGTKELMTKSAAHLGSDETPVNITFHLNKTSKGVKQPNERLV